MRRDSVNLLISYAFIHGLGSFITWILFTTNHPLRALPSTNLRYGLSIIFIILIYMVVGYLTMLARSKFLKYLSDAFKTMGVIIFINLISAIVFWMTSLVISLDWLNILASSINFPGYLFLFNPPVSILNLSMIIVLPPFAYTMGLLIRQTHH